MVITITLLNWCGFFVQEWCNNITCNSTHFSCPGLQDLEWISKGFGKNVRPQFLHSKSDFLLKSSKAWALYSSIAASKSLPGNISEIHLIYVQNAEKNALFNSPWILHCIKVQSICRYYQFKMIWLRTYDKSIYFSFL